MSSFVKSKYIWIMVRLDDMVCSYLLFANISPTQGIECQALGTYEVLANSLYIMFTLKRYEIQFSYR